MRLQRSFVLCILCILILMVSICTAGLAAKKRTSGKSQEPVEESTAMPRADPAYLQYLERQAMLAKSSEMARVVSGSELAWRSSASHGSPDQMLNYADTWISINPLTVLSSGRSSTFEQLTDSTLWSILREASIKGMYVSPVRSSGAAWAKERKGRDTGEDIVLYEFSGVAGKDNHYQRLISSIIDHSALLGSDMIPAATGLGPDFFLAARNVREYPGIYCMVDIPEALWTNLPEVTSDWEGVALSQGQIDALNAKGLLPKAMRDEVSPLARSGGWAATGKIRGVDGNNRRWVYRYYQNPQYAVLNWEDPSQTAHRILSGSAVRQVGLQGQALIGLRFEAFQGLEPAPEQRGNASSFSVEPALSAAQSMSREIRRYGGWSWMRDDDLPLPAVNEFLRAGTDFIFDSAFSPAGEHALLTGDAGFARFMADEVLRLRIDTRRLVHTLPTQDGINYTLPHLGYLASRSSGAKAGPFRQSLQGAMRSVASRQNPVPVKDGYLYTTSAGLAAMALGVSMDNIPANSAAEIAKGHSLLIFFKAMQPGALMLSGQDLVGLMPLNWNSMVSSPSEWDVADASRGSYALTSSSSGLTVTRQGMAKANSLYPTPDTQVHDKKSFLHEIGSYLRVRTEMGLARATLIARPATKGKGSIALLSRMPNGKSYLLAVSNFSRSPVTETISLAGTPGIASALSRITPLQRGTGSSHSVSGQTITITLGPWQGRALLLGAGPAKAGTTAEGAKDANQDEKITPIPTE